MRDAVVPARVTQPRQIERSPLGRLAGQVARKHLARRVLGPHEVAGQLRSPTQVGPESSAGCIHQAWRPSWNRRFRSSRGQARHLGPSKSRFIRVAEYGLEAPNPNYERRSFDSARRIDFRCVAEHDDVAVAVFLFLPQCISPPEGDGMKPTSSLRGCRSVAQTRRQEWHADPGCSAVPIMGVPAADRGHPIRPFVPTFGSRSGPRVDAKYVALKSCSQARGVKIANDLVRRLRIIP